MTVEMPRFRSSRWLSVCVTLLLVASVRGEEAVTAAAHGEQAQQVEGVVETELALDPARTMSKAELCAKDVGMSHPALRLIDVTPEPNPFTLPARYPRIFCFVNTISVHMDRAQAVAETWGQRCDHLMFFSNATDTITVGKGTPRERSYQVVELDVIADHNHLWQKHKASLQYVYEHFRHDYDWFYKADDDAYVILENLRAYLQRPEILMNYKRQPMQMGHRFNLTQELVDYYVVDDALEQSWRKRFHRWVFNSGGPGYVMNRLYMDKIISLIPEKTCLSDYWSEMLPDDAAISYCMMWHDVYPWDTRDLQGRERWHSDKPKGVYYVDPNDPDYWYVDYHHMIGGVRAGDDCCAPDSIAFHYISPPLMFHLERTLYFCREDDERIQDIAAFNDKYQLAIGDRVMVREKLKDNK
ncbi:hypothetical protein Poli38472_009512 [Pythium oligandrum]|uniref:N-acetylgalactosaminide beta-1,3-galactosyltransferase n=1 Tax=Pythium oligandrum TaxID=41045 RepID=A0A8K1CEK9_PYTOL|nr:hypothetical protein Poli38472_009512 [Pythium oligandrum]|eukprot:TMW62019.1 hypothetical protein Poli38472_009512 [Pythium oligandrum]